MWDYKLGHLTIGERTMLMLGRDAGPFVWFCRCCWAAFALWTMSLAGTEAHIAPVIWLIALLIYYYYPN